MAIEEVDQSGEADLGEPEASDGAALEEPEDGLVEGSSVRVGAYTWAEFMEEFGHEEEVSALYEDRGAADDELGLDAGVSQVPSGSDWDRVRFDPEAHLGHHPDDLRDLITDTLAPNAKVLQAHFMDFVDPETTPVTKDVYTWEHYKWEYYYRDDGSRPRTGDGEIEPFDETEALGFDPDRIEEALHHGGNLAMALDDVVEERTVDVKEELEEDEFFSTVDGHTTVVNRYDLEKAVPLEKKLHFKEEDRYWVNKPYAFVILFHSQKENEKKYYVIEPYLNEIETELREFLSGKLRTAIKYSEEGIKHKGNEEGRRQVIEEETRRLLRRYDLFEKSSGSTSAGIIETLRSLLEDEEEPEEKRQGQLDGIEVRPEPIILEEDPDTLNEYQVEKLLYRLKRDFIGYERIDPIKYDINVEDISCNGYNSPVFVYHTEYEQIISNVYHGEDELDEFVVKLAQRSGKGISKRMPQVDATLPDGSRAQLTLGKEVSDHGTNYTIRQFKEVPFTPVDLINWNTFSLDQMAFLWLCIENHKSLIFAGGTASGKTTSLNAVSLFIPSGTKIVSIEDTREVELPQRNWIASVTRPSFTEDDQGDVDEFALLEAALRQRPDYIVMGEIRGEEGRTLFQVMSTGHTTYTTFHADSVEEVIKRFTTDPINVSKTMFTALDLISIQTQTRVQGHKVRRNKSLTEINHYEAENDEINVQAVYEWQPETDEYLQMGESNTLDEIMFDRGWTEEKLEEELFKRRVVIAYLIKNELNAYTQVAATAQAFINDPETVLTLIANGQLEQSLEDLRDMESVEINVDPEKEEVVPRPDPTQETLNISMDILERAEDSLFEEYRGEVPSGLASALGTVEEADPIEVEAEPAGETVSEVDFESGSADFDFGEGPAEEPDWFGEAAGEPADGAATASAADASGDGGPAAAKADAGADADAATDAGGGLGAAPTSLGGEGGTTADTGGQSTADPTDAGEALSGGAGSAAALEGRQEGALEDVAVPELDAAEAAVTEEGIDEEALIEDEDDLEAELREEFEAELQEDVSGLFGDFEAELEELEALEDSLGGTPEDQPEAATDSDSTATESAEPSDEVAIDTSDFDRMFPDTDLQSIFGEGADEDRDRSGSFGSGSPESTTSDAESGGWADSDGGEGDGIFGEGAGDRESADAGESMFEDAEDDPFGGWDDGDAAWNDDSGGWGAGTGIDEQDESGPSTGPEDEPTDDADDRSTDDAEDGSDSGTDGRTSTGGEEGSDDGPGGRSDPESIGTDEPSADDAKSADGTDDQ